VDGSANIVSINNSTAYSNTTFFLNQDGDNKGLTLANTSRNNSRVDYELFGVTNDGTQFLHNDNSTRQQLLLMSRAEAAFNDGGANQDFRVESDTNTHMLFVDASANRVGFGASSPGSVITAYSGAGLDGRVFEAYYGSGANRPLNIGINRSGGDAWLGWNAYQSSGDAQIRQVENFSALIRSQDGGVRIQGAASDTAGSAITWTRIADLLYTGTVFNEDSNDLDFRVESDTNTHMLFVDAGNNRVAIGDNTPQRTFSVQGGSDFLEPGNNTSGGTIRLASNMTDNTVQYGYITARQYAFVSEPEGYTIIGATSLVDANTVNIGGGIDEHNIATAVSIYAGPTTSTRNTGVVNLAMLATSGSTVFNENGEDRDFRVESDSNANMLVVDAGNNQIHIGKGAGNFATAGGTFYQEGELNLTTNDNRTPLFLNRQQSDGGIIAFYRTTTSFVGSISVTASATAYNTSSDYRLKEDVQPMVGASDRLMALKPVNFAWKVNGSRVDGFLAHEAKEVVPEAVTGEKDAVDKDGKPEYQGIDQSKLVPLLTAALQEALQKIETLEARIAALETQ